MAMLEVNWKRRVSADRQVRTVRPRDIVRMGKFFAEFIRNTLNSDSFIALPPPAG